MNGILKYTAGLIVMSVVFCNNMSLAQPPGYYDSAFGKGKEELKTALMGIVKDHTERTYANLWTDFQSTDNKGENIVWDIYSDSPGGNSPYVYCFVSDQCGNYSKEGDCYNREHSMPKSWFNDATPMYTDLFHLYPTDGWVNNKRGNYPYGVVKTVNWTSQNGSKLGNSDPATGYSDMVFEPVDTYKGDFARTYFYMVTCYEDKVPSWTGSEAMKTLNATTYPSFQSWAINVLLAWHRSDPLSEKEINRNEAIYDIQRNRNPFIDYPQLAEYIWGDSTDYVFNPKSSIDDMYEMHPVLFVESGTLVLKNLQEGNVIQLYSLNGISLRRQQAFGTEAAINLPGRGFYIVRIIDRAGNQGSYKITY